MWSLVLPATFCFFSICTGQNLRGNADNGIAGGAFLNTTEFDEDYPNWEESFDATEAEERSLMRSTDLKKDCFGPLTKANYFARNPYNSDKKEQKLLGRRGDWAKCLPTPTYAIMCIHPVHHGFNPDPLQNQMPEKKNSTKHRGQKHDWHAGILFETLLEMHEERCASLDLSLTPAAKEALNDYMMGIGEYEPEPEPEPEAEAEAEAEAESEAECEAEPEPETEPEPGKGRRLSGSEPEPEPEAEPEVWMPDGPGRTVKWHNANQSKCFRKFRNCTMDLSTIANNRTRLRKSLYCAMAGAAKPHPVPHVPGVGQFFQDMNTFLEFHGPGQIACEILFKKDGSLPNTANLLCPEDGGQSCSAHPRLFRLHRSLNAQEMTCEQFCGRYKGGNGAPLKATRAAMSWGGSCHGYRPWGVQRSPTKRHRPQELLCTCKDESRQFDPSIKVRRVTLPRKKEDGSCSRDVRIVLHLDLLETGLLTVMDREQFVDRNHVHHDTNEMGGYELCHGKELTKPKDIKHCSVGGRTNLDPTNSDSKSACFTRLEQLTYDEASAACKARGGILAKATNKDEVEELRKFGDKHHLGIGLRDTGTASDEAWVYDDGASAKSAVELFDVAFNTRRRRNQPNFKRDGCVLLASSRRRRPALLPTSCESKVDWVCQGTLDNNLNSAYAVKNDLMADEGAFCLWHIHEPVDVLPNDEGTNFNNCDLQCHLQTSSREKKRCKYDPDSRRRSLVSKRGARENGLNYPVKGAVIGWEGFKANLDFLKLKNSDDYFHCHYTPGNDGLLRMYAMQHMFDRMYPGSMRRTCGCGFKYLAQLVSRCDCTRSGRRDNNCATWHRKQLLEATQDINPVRCNNCNSKHNM